MIKTITMHCTNTRHGNIKMKTHNHNNYALLRIGRVASCKFEQIIRVLEVMRVICKIGTRDLSEQIWMPSALRHLNPHAHA